MTPFCRNRENRGLRGDGAEPYPAAPPVNKPVWRMADFRYKSAIRHTQAVLGGTNRRRNSRRVALPSAGGGIARGRSGAARAAYPGRKFLQLVPGQNLIRPFPAVPGWTYQNGDRITLAGFCGEARLWSFSGPTCARNPPHFSSDSPISTETDGLDGERGGFKPPVPRKSIRAEFGPSLAHYLARQKCIRAQENLFACDSAPLRLSPVRFVRHILGSNGHRRRLYRRRGKPA